MAWVRTRPRSWPRAWTSKVWPARATETYQLWSELRQRTRTHSSDAGEVGWIARPRLHDGPQHGVGKDHVGGDAHLAGGICPPAGERLQQWIVLGWRWRNGRRAIVR